jgi:K+ transporter
MITKVLNKFGIEPESLVHKIISKTVDAFTICGDNGTSAIYSSTIACSLLLKHFKYIDSNIALGVTSLIIWTAILVFYLYMFGLVYVTDLEGKIEGGSPAFLMLIRQLKQLKVPIATWVSTLVLVMMALTAPDFWLTGAISLLAAFGGLKIANPELPQYMVYIPACIVAWWFFGPLMRQGIGKINSYFGPITLVWFVLVSGFSISMICINPQSLLAFKPIYAFRLLQSLPFSVNLALFGALILIITGWEAAQLDRKDYLLKDVSATKAVLPIQLAFSINTVTNVLSVLAQCSLLLNLCSGKTILPGVINSVEFAQPRITVAHELPNLFFGLLPGWAVIFMVGYAVVEVIIAATATTLGAQNLFAELHGLGLWYRMPRQFTNMKNSHEFYVRPICESLKYGCIGLMLWAQTDEKLANAYGTSVVCGMLVGSLLAFILAPYAIQFSNLNEKYKPWMSNLSKAFFAFFVILFIPYLLGGLSKVFEGSWITLLGALLFFLFLDSYKWGEQRVNQVLSISDKTVSDLYQTGTINMQPPSKTDRIGILLTKPGLQLDDDIDKAPAFLVSYVLKHGSIPSQLISIAINIDKDTSNKPNDRFKFHSKKCDGYCLSHLVATYGWADKIEVLTALEYANKKLNEALLEERIAVTGDSNYCLQPSEVINLSEKSLYLTGMAQLKKKPTTNLINQVRFRIYEFIRSNLATPFHKWVGITSYDALAIVNMSIEI